MEVAFGRERETGQLYVRLTSEDRRICKPVTLFDLDVMAMRSEVSGDVCLAALCRSFTDIVLSTPVGQALPSTEFDGGQFETMLDWFDEGAVSVGSDRPSPSA